MDDMGRTLLAASLHDGPTIRSLGGAHGVGFGAGVGARTESLVQLAALVCLDAPTPTFQMVVDRALAAGVESADLLAMLGAITPLVGEARVVAAAGGLAAALGYDLDAALEDPDSLDPDAEPRRHPRDDPWAGLG